MPLSKARDRERKKLERVQPKDVQPKYEPPYLYPDGRVPDMPVIQFNQARMTKIMKSL